MLHGVISGILHIAALAWRELNWKSHLDENKSSSGNREAKLSNFNLKRQFLCPGGLRTFTDIVSRALKYFKLEAIGNKLLNFVSGTRTLYVTCSRDIYKFMHWWSCIWPELTLRGNFPACVDEGFHTISPLVKHFAQPVVNYSRHFSFAHYSFQSLNPLSRFGSS